MRHLLRKRLFTKLLAGFVLAIIAGLFFGWLGEEVLENDTVQFDRRAGALVHGESQPGLTQFMEVITTMGSPLLVTMLSLVAAIVFWLKHMRRQAAVLAIAIVGAAVLTYALKIGFHRVRPQPYFGIAVPGSFSFPSGHSLTAICLYGVLAYLVSSQFHRGFIRAGIWTFAIVMILLIGFSRLYLGVHYASDVIAGYSAGLVWVLVLISVEHSIRQSEMRGPEQDDSLGTTR